MLHVGNQKGRVKGEKMKSVLISVRPKWCELIASGKKTIEVRKTRPKIETPFTVYVYMTKHKWIFKLLPFLKNRFAKVIGEFVCDRIICCQAYYGDSGKKHLTNLFGVDTSKRQRQKRRHWLAVAHLRFENLRKAERVGRVREL